MAFVSVPKDLTKVKNKIIFNLTKRQLICFGIAAAVGVPFYFLTRGIIGSSNAATGMCLLMLPAFLFSLHACFLSAQTFFRSHRKNIPIHRIPGADG